MDKIIHVLSFLNSPITVMLIGAYVFFESFTATNEMDRVSLKRFFHEMANPYTVKYWGVGLYGLAIIYFSNEITSWNILLTFPAVLCVSRRTLYRIKSYIGMTKQIGGLF